MAATSTATNQANEPLLRIALQRYQNFLTAVMQNSVCDDFSSLGMKSEGVIEVLSKWEFDDSFFMNSVPVFTSVISSENSELDPPDEKRACSFQSQLYQRFQANAVRPQSEEEAICGLPSNLIEALKKHRGISSLYDWQKAVLSHPNIVSGRNLIITLPTGGGKTLLAEILILKQLLCQQKDALFVLPYVSIVQEKVKGLLPLGLDLEFLVEEYASNKGRIPPIKRRRKKSVYVSTIEKAQALVNSLFESKKIGNLGLVIVDELHLIGVGGNRGAALEQLISKLLYCAQNCQLIGISATLSNLEDLTTFLKADLFTANFRPVSLTEYVKVENILYKVNSNINCRDSLLEFYRHLPTAQKSRDPDNLSFLVNEVIPSASCLVFCPTKKSAENVCIMLSQTLPSELTDHKSKEKRKLLEDMLEECGRKLCSIQKRCILYGLAYHHSGLTTDERRLIQDAFLEGTLCVLCCTSTLAAGVNLPAKRVILRSLTIGNRPIMKQEYTQMTGRAGRAGLDDSGESVIVIQRNQKDQLEELLTNVTEQCRSSLMDDNGRGLKNLLLSIIGLEMICSKADLIAFFKKTLFYIQFKNSSEISTTDLFEDSLRYLVNEGFILINRKNKTTFSSDSIVVQITNFGKAVCKSGIDIQISKQVYSDLTIASQSMMLTTRLHLIYCSIPYTNQEELNISWDAFYNEYNKLDKCEMKMLEAFGIDMCYIIKRKQGIAASKDLLNLSTLNRVYAALILRQIWNQHNLWDVAAAFAVSRGYIQHLIQSAASFASSLLRFCEQMEDLWALKSLLSDFSRALAYCVRAELVPLMEIQGVQKMTVLLQARAIQLYNAGFTTVASVARSDVLTLISSVDHLSMKQAAQMISSAKMILNEKVEALMEQAEEVLGKQDSSDVSVDEIVSTLRESIHVNYKIVHLNKTNVRILKLEDQKADVKFVRHVSSVLELDGITNFTLPGSFGMSRSIIHYWATIILINFIKSNDLWDVTAAFAVSRGYIQHLIQSAASFASSLLRFCEVNKQMWQC
ncbi:Helicase POLQ-like [Trichinella patagoniensis]|uniref:Helicase POLQ-like n=1 Tax=Trichinella patagoniensis TaxID=990121 RepID=A0A0V0Z9Q3_9BILA|nr:Helicase POLQ-like [Trichinella patagoniensis]